MSKKNKTQQEFVSNVTGEQWQKHNSANWARVINHIGIVTEDIVHQGKNNTTKTLPKGSEVFIDDIRGRIKPQYRVKDDSGKIWFIPVTQIEVQNADERISDEEISFAYRGGVRHDGSPMAPQRYTISKTTEDEIREAKEKKRKK